MKNSDNLPAPKTIDEYLMPLPEAIQIVLEQLRQKIRDTAPQAEELINYNIPAFKYQGMLVYFAAFKNHCTFFVGNGSLVNAMKAELKDYKTVTSGIHFTVDKPLPDALVEKIVLMRMRQNEEIQRARALKKR
jgi:uncharacterized protein YdhG (YjbR/CyaY superfamily)